MAHTSASEQFSLRWVNFSSNLTSGVLSHLSDNDLVDVTLAVEGKLLHAHKLILSVCSPYFKNIFKVNPCQHPVVILKDMGYTEVGALLRFMYQGEVHVRQDDLAAFLKVAESLQIKGLTARGAKREPHDHDSLSGDGSDLSPPLENMEVDKRLTEEITRNCSKPNLPANRTTSPPRLKEMDIPTNTPDEVTKADLSVLDLCNDEFVLAPESPANLSIPNHVLRPDAIIYLKDDQNTNADQKQQPLNSLVNLRRSRRDIIQKKIRRFDHPRLYLGGYIYCQTHRLENKIYWRCRCYKKLCRARSITAAEVILRSTGRHNHKPETRNVSDYYVDSGKMIPCKMNNLKTSAASSGVVQFPLI